MLRRVDHLKLGAESPAGVLFPARDGLGSIERLALSLGLSLAVVPLIALILNYTPWGVRLYPLLTSLAVYTVLVSLIAGYRRHNLTADTRFFISFNIDLSRWLSKSLVDKAFFILPKN